MSNTEKYWREFCAGNEAAFQQLYAETSTMLYRVVLRMVGGREEAEDILHDVYLKAYEHRRAYRPELAGMRTWLYRIAVNHTLNYLKRRRWLSVRLDWLLGRREERDILDGYAEAEEGAQMQRLLQKLPDNYRICLILRDLEDKSYEDIAAALHLELGTVKSRLSRGRSMLKTMYAKEVSET